jgi:predicted metal-binding membrane protein
MERMTDTSVLERVLRRDRTVTLSALLSASLLAWTYILAGAGMPESMPDMSMPGMSMPGISMPMASDWTPAYFALMLAMWCIMMVAMMLPSTAPMILLFATVERRRGGGSPFLATVIFAAAYIIVWLGFSIIATVLQWQLDRLTLLSPAMASTSALFAAIILIAVGVYQFTPLKRACLRGCRSPLEFISRYWNRGPFGIGLRHGLYCVGCCGMVMLLLFVGGIMNLLWVALIAAFILVEKIIPRGEWLSYGAGAALIGLGGWMLYTQV